MVPLFTFAVIDFLQLYDCEIDNDGLRGLFERIAFTGIKL